MRQILASKGQDQGHDQVKYAAKCTFWPCICRMLAEA